MNKNHIYAYLLLGAVVLAGAGGFMFSESFSSEEVEVPVISTGTISFTILNTNVDSDGGESNGETS